MAKTDRQIEAYVRGNEGIGQQRAVEELAEITGKCTKTIREHLKNLNQRTLVGVRSGREMLWYSRERWGRIKALDMEKRISHAKSLKEVLRLFENHIPVADEFGVFHQLGYQPSAPWHNALRYDPDRPLEIETHVLFDDLLYHLGLLDVKPNPTSAWSTFKEEVRTFVPHCEDLWKLCETHVAGAFRLPVGMSSRANWASEHCVAFHYMLALAIAMGDRERVKRLRSEPAKVDDAGKRFDYWKGGYLLVRRTKTDAGNGDRFRKWVRRRLGVLEREARNEEFLVVARRIPEKLKILTGVRERLVRTLKRASYYEDLPGPCEFVGGLSALSKEAVNSS